MTASVPAIVRGIRAGSVRDLVRRAVDQGFDVSMTGGGHVRLVGPEGVAMTSASSTERDWHHLKRFRSELIRAGFQPDWNPRQARRQARDDLTALTVEQMLDEPTSHEVPQMTSPRLPQPTERPPILVAGAEHRPPAPGKGEAHARYRTGAHVFVSDDVVNIAGVDVRMRRQAGGALYAWTPPDAPTTDRKTWSVSPRASRTAPERTQAEQAEIVAAKVAEWVAAGKPDRPHQTSRPSKSKAPEEGRVERTNGVAVEPSPEAMPAARSSVPVEDEPSVAWLTVRLDRSEYPLASSLAELVDRIAPAIQALEASGRKAAADLLVESVELSDVERELVKLWQEVNGRPRLEHGRRPSD